MADFDSFVPTATEAPPSSGRDFGDFAPLPGQPRTQKHLTPAKNLEEMFRDVGLKQSRAPAAQRPRDTFLSKPKVRTQFDLGAPTEVKPSLADQAIRLGGETLANTISAADMVLSLPAFVMSQLADAGARITGAVASPWTGETGKEISAGGRRAAERVLHANPLSLGKLASTLGGRPYEDQSQVGAAMEQVGSAAQRTGQLIEESTGGVVPAEDYLTMFDTAMLAVGPGVARMRAKSTPLRPPLGEPEMPAVMRSNRERPLVRSNRTPGEPYQPAIPGLKGERLPLREFLDQTLVRLEDSKTQRQIRRADATSAFEAQGRVERAKAAEDAAWQEQFNAERQAREQRIAARETQATEAAREGNLISELPTTQSDILRIMQKPGWARTAEDLVALREARNKAFAIGGAATALGAMSQLDEADQGAALATFVLAAPNVRKVAERRAARGQTREQIWEDLGVWQDKSGQWLTEVSDLGAKLQPGLERNKFMKELVMPVSFFEGPKKLSEILDHPRLFQERPWLKDVEVRSTGISFDVQGAAGKGKMWLAGGKDAEVLSTVLHEVNHLLQEAEKRPLGGSPNLFTPEGHAKRVEKLNKLKESHLDRLRTKFPDFNPFTYEWYLNDKTRGLLRPEQLAKYDEVIATPLGQRYATLLKAAETVRNIESEAYQKYQRIAGEAESRLVEARQSMTAQQRKETPPWETLRQMGVDEGELTVRMEGDAPAASIKEKGGNWDPGTVGWVTTPLRRALGAPDMMPVGRPPDPAAAPKRAWAERAVQNWLNRYAGTKADPLKDIEIPYGAGTKRWEDVTDAAFTSRVAGPQQDYVPNVRPGETFWERSRTGAPTELGAQRALTSYLSHVGDFLRQNVPLEKLAQYDLIRAVKETAANDARMAKEAAKAQADATTQLPVHKAYPDGYKWVELKLPEKLTPEQAKGVQELTRRDYELELGVDIVTDIETGLVNRLKREPTWAELRKEIAYGDASAAAMHPYRAIDAEGNPVQNRYTGELAGGATPEHAWLAGQLAREGNAMGHCVGGYCQDVATGDTKIYSLRDPKGQSHVTVEVAPQSFTTDVTGELGRKGERWADGRRPDNILQIKGKQNRAPKAEYLPYVQDFVKSGKWGEVGDLENTGLVRHEAGYYTPEELARGPAGQRGSADPKLLRDVALIGGGAALLAALDPEQAGRAALLGAGLGYAAPRLPWHKLVQGADKYAGLVSTRLQNISKPLYGRLMNYEFNLSRETYRHRAQVDPFLIRLNKLPENVKGALSRAMLTGQAGGVEKILGQIGDAELTRGWQAVRGTLTELGQNLERLGRITPLENYFPRIVKDRDGLLAALGREAGGHLNKLLMEAETRAIRQRGRGLTQAEESAIINNYLMTPLRKGSQPSWAKSRRINEITEQLEPFYLNPTDSLHAHIRAAVRDLEMAKLFGKDAIHVEKGGRKFLNEDASIGELVRRAREEGKLTRAQEAELGQLLRARFMEGEQASGKLVTDVRNLAYLGLLGNFVSAAAQLGDPFISAYTQGLRPTLTAVAQVLTGKSDLRMKDFGLADHISEEFVTTGRTARWVNATFKHTLGPVDAFGKNITLNAALNAGRLKAQTAKGQAELARKYKEVFGEPEFNALVRDLKSGQRTPTTDLYAFHELSRTQPISKLEVPQAYLENPNGRVLYTLKTWMLKQADLVRRESYNEIKAGNRARGLKNLTEIAIAMGIAGATTDMIKDFLMGHPFDARWEDIPQNALKTFGWSQYVLDKARGGHLVEAIGGTLLPPWQMFDDILSRDESMVKYFPWVGKLLWEHSPEGKAAFEKRQKLEQSRRIDREVKPWWGKPSEAQKEEAKERKRLLRELNAL